MIGASWAAQFLGHGLDVVAADPAPGAEERLRADVAGHWPTVTRIGLAPGASPDRLRFVAQPARPPLRPTSCRRTVPSARTSSTRCSRSSTRPRRPEVVIASSSSGLLPTTIAARCAPSIPSACSSGTRSTRRTSSRWSRSCRGSGRRRRPSRRRWRSTPASGKRPIRLRQELPGHVANRLQAALWREAYSLVERGVATVADIDTAISHGPGPALGGARPVRQPAPLRRPGRASRTCSSTSARPPSAGGATSGTPTLTPRSSCATLVAGVDDELAGRRPGRARRRTATPSSTQLLAAKARPTSVRDRSCPSTSTPSRHRRPRPRRAGRARLPVARPGADRRLGRRTSTPTPGPHPDRRDDRRALPRAPDRPPSSSPSTRPPAPGTRRCPARRSPTPPPSTPTC